MKKEEHWNADCRCETCQRYINHLGIMSHRAMHKRKKEKCEITFYNQMKTITYDFTKEQPKTKYNF